MKFKLDENLGTRCVKLFTEAGHDAATIVGQGMSAAIDEDVIAACAGEGRALVTLDLDFSNPFKFAPEGYAGIGDLRPPKDPCYDGLIATVKTLIGAVKTEELKGHLWSIEIGRIRVYQPRT